MQTKRLEYIDLARGVCMLLLVVGHTGLQISIPGITYAIVPLFFALSGYFFKKYHTFADLIIRKTNTLIIPFLFFYITAYIVFYLIQWICPNLLVTDAKGILDVLNNRQFFNGPIWFLIALFWCNIFFYLIINYLNKELARVAAICIIGFTGWYMGYKSVFLPFFLDVAMTCIPFFTFGYYYKKFVINSGLDDKYDKYLFGAFWIISIIIEMNMHQRLSLHYNIIEGWSTYPLSFTSIICLIYLCKIIRSISFVNYIGRYSLIILCVHHMIYRPLLVLFKRYPTFEFNGFTVAFFTVLLSTACVPLFLRFFPYFVAQRDLIKTRNKND